MTVSFAAYKPITPAHGAACFCGCQRKPAFSAASVDQLNQTYGDIYNGYQNLAAGYPAFDAYQAQALRDMGTHAYYAGYDSRPIVARAQAEQGYTRALGTQALAHAGYAMTDLNYLKARQGVYA